MLRDKQYGAIGKAVPRVEAEPKVAGQTRYAADVTLPAMLWAKVLRSPYPHARILFLFTSEGQLVENRALPPHCSIGR